PGVPPPRPPVRAVLPAGLPARLRVRCRHRGENLFLWPASIGRAVLLKRGAEAELRRTKYLGRDSVEKSRVPKGYRPPALDVERRVEGRRPPAPEGGPHERARPGARALRGRCAGVPPRVCGGRGGPGEGEGDRGAGPVHVITFVTTNAGKFREVSATLAPLGVRLRR